MKATCGVKHSLVEQEAPACRTRPRAVQPRQRPAAHRPPARKGRPRAAMALTVAATAALLGCSSLTPAPWRVEPLYRVEDSGAATAQGYLALARQYEGEQRTAQALDAYRKAAQAAPDDADVQNALGLALARQAQYGPAVLALRRAVALAPERAALLNNLGYALLLDKRTEEARAMFRLTLAVDPAHEMAASNLHWINQPPVAAAAQAAPADQAVRVAKAEAPAAPAEAPAAPAAAPAPPAEVPAALPPEAAGRLTLHSLHSAALLQASMSQAVAALEPAVLPVSMPAAAPLQAPLAAATAATAVAPATVAVAAVAAAAAAVPAPAPMPSAMASLEGVSIEIVNGNGVTGAAARLRQWLGQQGITAGRLANLRPYDSQQTRVLYRSGKAGAAHAVAERMPLHAEVAPAPAGSTRADVHVLIGHDARYSAGCATIAACAAPDRLASSLGWQARAAAGEVELKR